jgi:putative FmdB family regulatory protein
MPVYEYQCKACNREFEYQQRMSDPDKTTCEACGGTLERLISRTAFALKGSGWYKDLYASPKAESKPTESTPSEPKPSETGDKKPSGSGDSGSSGSSDSGGSSGTSSSGSSQSKAAASAM